MQVFWCAAKRSLYLICRSENSACNFSYSEMEGQLNFCWMNLPRPKTREACHSHVSSRVTQIKQNNQNWKWKKKKEGRKHTRRQKKACRFARTKKPELQQQRQQRNITLSVRFSNLFEKQNITFGESVDSSTCFQIFSKSFLLCFFFLRLWHCETQIRIYYLRR